MKKLIAIAAFCIMALSLCACGGSSGTAPEAGTTGDTQQANGDQKSQYYFSDGVLVSKDVKIEITDYKVIPVGEKGNEYGEKPVIAFWYNTTNISGSDSVTPMNAWIAMFSAYQDTDANQVNRLDAGTLPDQAFLDSQMETVKKDGTAPCAISYELDSTSVPVVLKATQGIGGDSLGEQTFDIAK